MPRRYGRQYLIRRFNNIAMFRSILDRVAFWNMIGIQGNFQNGHGQKVQQPMEKIV